MLTVFRGSWRLCLVFCLAAALVGAPAQSTLERAIAAHKAGKAIEAINLYQEALREAPSSFTAHYNLGLLLMSTGQLESAIAHLNTATSIEPNRPEPYLARANAYAELGDLDRALQALMNGEASNQRIPQYWLTRASIEAALGSLDKATVSAHRAASVAPSMPLILSEIGRFLTVIGDLAGAEEQISKARGLAPSNLDLLDVHVDLLLKLKRTQDALALASAELKKDPQSARRKIVMNRVIQAASGVDAALNDAIQWKTNSPDSDLLAVRKAELYLAANRTDDARRSLEEAIRKNPNLPPARLLHGELLLAASQPEAALEDAICVLKQTPRDPRPHSLAWRAFTALGAKSEAVAALRSWSILVPHDPTPLLPLASALLEAENYTMAAPLLERYIRLRPDDLESYDRLGQAYLGSQNAEKGIGVLEKVIAEGRKSADIFVRLALCYRQIGQHANVILTLRKMRTEFPSDLRSWTLEAATHEGARQFQTAYAVYEDLYKSHPENSAGLEGMARSLGLMGKPLEAAEVLRTLAEKFPDYKSAYLLAARNYAAGKQTAKADFMWAELMSKQPADRDIWTMHAQFLAETERKPEAIQAFLDCIPKWPDHEPTYRAAAVLYADAKQFSKACDVLLQASQTFHLGRDALAELEKYSKQANRVEEFDRELARLILLPDVPQHAAMAYVQSSQRLGQLPSALRVLQERTSAAPKNAALWVARSRCEALLGDAKAAVQSIRSASEADPQSVEYARLLATAAETEGDFPLAAAAYARLSTLVPHEPAYRLKQAAYLDEIGERAEAIAVLEAASHRFYNNKDVLSLLKKLRGDAGALM